MTEFYLKDGEDNDLAAKIREIIGVGPCDDVLCVTPQFERTDGKNIIYFPHTVEEFEKIKTLDDEMLKELGLQEWENGHWLFPGEWYEYIPDGYEIITISGKMKKFEKGNTGDDIRHGCLAYGFIKTPILFC